MHQTHIGLVIFSSDWKRTNLAEILFGQMYFLCSIDSSQAADNRAFLIFGLTHTQNAKRNKQNDRKHEKSVELKNDRLPMQTSFDCITFYLEVRHKEGGKRKRHTEREINPKNSKNKHFE